MGRVQTQLRKRKQRSCTPIQGAILCLPGDIARRVQPLIPLAMTWHHWVAVSQPDEDRSILIVVPSLVHLDFLFEIGGIAVIDQGFVFQYDDTIDTSFPKCCA